MTKNRRSVTESELDHWIEEAVAAERGDRSPDSHAFLTRLRTRLDHRFAPSTVASRRRRRVGWGLAAAIPLAVLLAVSALVPSGNDFELGPQDLAIIRDLELLEFLQGLEPELETLEVGSLLEYLQNVPFLDNADAELLEVSG